MTLPGETGVEFVEILPSRRRTQCPRSADRRTRIEAIRHRSPTTFQRMLVDDRCISKRASIGTLAWTAAAEPTGSRACRGGLVIPVGFKFALRGAVICRPNDRCPTASRRARPAGSSGLGTIRSRHGRTVRAGPLPEPRRRRECSRAGTPRRRARSADSSYIKPISASSVMPRTSCRVSAAEAEVSWARLDSGRLVEAKTRTAARSAMSSVERLIDWWVLTAKGFDHAHAHDTGTLRRWRSRARAQTPPPLNNRLPTAA